LQLGETGRGAPGRAGAPCARIIASVACSNRGKPLSVAYSIGAQAHWRSCASRIVAAHVSPLGGKQSP